MPQQDQVSGILDLPKARRVIVFADLVESVRLMQDFEAAAIDHWRRFVIQVREQTLPERGGQLVRTAGDGLLMSFASAAQAIEAAFELHHAIGGIGHLGANRDSMSLRIGMHLTHVVFDRNEAYGAGVNLAARLAALAQPGETLVSADLRDALVDALHARIEDLGMRFVKHLKDPIRVFSVRPVGSVPGSSRRWHGHASGDDLRPGIAVVPFTCTPQDPVHDALGHAIADDTIAALSRNPGLRPLSRATTAAFKDCTLDIMRLRQLRELLNVTFVLTGRYYIMGTKVRVSVELCALPSGEVQWAGSMITQVDDVFAGCDDLVPQIVTNVSQQVAAYELGRVRSLPMDTLPSYTLFLGATGLMNSLGASDFERAKEVMEHLVERHPRQAAGHAMLARWHVFKVVQGWAEDLGAESARARDCAQRAIDIDPRQAVALAALALVHLNFDEDVESARRLNEMAIEANPLEPHAWAQMSAAQCFAGAHEAARGAARQAISISPLDPNLYLFESYAAMAALAAGSHADAVLHAKTSLRHHALHAPSHRILVGSLWLSGQCDEARTATQRYLQHCPRDRLARHGRNRGAIPEWRKQFAEALRHAGVPTP